MPELRLDGGLGVCSSSQRDKHMQRHAAGDHNGMFENFRGFSLTCAGEGVLNEWQEMCLRKQRESSGGSCVPNPGS